MVDLLPRQRLTDGFLHALNIHLDFGNGQFYKLAIFLFLDRMSLFVLADEQTQCTFFISSGRKIFAGFWMGLCSFSYNSMARALVKLIFVNFEYYLSSL